MLVAIAGQDIPWGIAEDVYRSTEGNPLFVQEVIRHLVEDGQVRREEGQWRGLRRSDVTMKIPEGLRDVIGKRMSSLSPGCNELLAKAAVIGREFRLRVLRSIADVSESELHSVLEEAKGTHVVEERESVGATVRYRFTHAFFRQTLYEEMIAPARIRIHQQVARALESAYGSRLEEHATELSEHFSHSSDPADLSKAVSYGEMAANAALEALASGEAVRLLEQALKVQQVLDPDDRAKRCDLLISLCGALIGAAEPRRALDNEAKEAFSIAEDLGDTRRASSICRLAGNALAVYGQGPAASGLEAGEWALKADRYAKPDTVERVWADMALGCIERYGRHYGKCVFYYTRAFDLAKSIGDPAIYRSAALGWIHNVWSPRYAAKQLLLAEEMTELSQEGVALSGPGHVLLAHGKRERVEEICNEFRSVTERRGQELQLLGVKEDESRFAFLDGRLEEAIEISDEIEALGKELNLNEATAVVLCRIRPRPELLLGRSPRIQPASTNQPVCSPLEYMMASAAPAIDVPRRIRGFHKHREIFTDAENTGQSWLSILYLEAAVILEYRESVELLYHHYKECGIHTTGVELIASAGRILGMAAAFLGRPDEARDHYQDAIEVTTNMRFRPELALTRCQMAELLLEHYPEEHAEALEHLDFALEEFKEMKMKPYIEKAQALKESL